MGHRRKGWTPPEEKLLKDNYLTLSNAELVALFKKKGYRRTIRSIEWKLCDLGLVPRSYEPFCYRVTNYVDSDDPVLVQTEHRYQSKGTPYIICDNTRGKCALFAQPGRIFSKPVKTKDEEPPKRLWIRTFKHPTEGTWPIDGVMIL